MKKVATIITSASIIVLVLMACSSNNKAAIADNSKDTTAVRINDGTPDTSSIKNSEGELGDGTNGQYLVGITRYANLLPRTHAAVACRIAEYDALLG